MCSADANNNCTSDYSNIALGAKLNFATDATIVGYSEDSSNATAIKAAHITELRTAINAVRTLAGQSSASWTHSGLAAGDLIYADDVRDLRSALNYALVALNIQTSNYTDNTIVSYADDPLTATTIKAVHIREVRQRSTSGAGNSTSGGSSGGLHYVLSDLQGSARAVMNNNSSSSAIVARHDYLPFGEEIGAIGGRTSGQGYTATDQNRWKYGMTERDATSGLDHTWFRKYESLSGRWTTPDPISGGIADPQSFNHYNYAANDAGNLVDPEGLDSHGPGLPGLRPPAPPLRFLDPSQTGMTFNAPTSYDTGDGGGGGDDAFISTFDNYVKVLPQNPTPGQNPRFDPKKPECLPKDIKDQLQTIYTRTLQADASQRLQEFGFTIESNGTSLSPSKIVSGKVDYHGVDLHRNGPATLLAAHSHGAFDLIGASPPDVQGVQSGIGKGLPIYIVSRGGIILFDPNDKSTQGRFPGSEPGNPSYGVKVGELTGKNSIFKKPCN